MGGLPRSPLIMCFPFQAFRAVIRSLKPGAFSLLIFSISSDIKTIIEDTIKIDLKIRKKSLKERNIIDTEKMTLFVSNVVKKDILVNIVTFKER